MASSSTADEAIENPRQVVNSRLRTELLLVADRHFSLLSKKTVYFLYICICCHVSGCISSLIWRYLDSLLEEFAQDLDVRAGVVNPLQGWEAGFKKTAVLRGVTPVSASLSG